MEILEYLACPGTAARPGHAMTPRYITIHNTANTNKGAGAVSHARYLRGAGKGKAVSYHYAVDDQCAVRILPDTENAWHAGDGANGTGNRQSLAIEICENPESDLAAATDRAALLTARLMRDWGIPIGRVVQHHHWSGKDCPRRLRRGEPYSWDAFLDKVRAYAAQTEPGGPAQADGAAPSDGGDLAAQGGALYTVQAGAFQSRENARAYAAKLAEKGVQAYVAAKEG